MPDPSDKEHEPERGSPNGGKSPGADPDQDDNRKDSSNGDLGRKSG